MYFITGIESLDKPGSRTFGYKENFQEANIAVRDNWMDMNENGEYPYIVIEHIFSGIYPNSCAEFWYKFNLENKIYMLINKPQELAEYCNFALG